MSIKRIIDQKGNTVKLTIRYDNEFDEYSVRYYLNGIFNENRTAYCSDLKDAVDTMNFCAGRIESGIEIV